LYKELQKSRAEGKELKKSTAKGALRARTTKNDEEEDSMQDISYDQLAENMKEEHGLALKKTVFQNMRAEESIINMGLDSEQEKMRAFLSTLSEKEQRKLMKKLLSGTGGKRHKKSKKELKEGKIKKNSKSEKKKRKESKAKKDSKNEKKKKHRKHTSS
uniref:Protein SDA1 n=1 Tax=Gongylonema pulchrum TaxID=637853 RepID=A0A183CU86_9BILA